jgi:PGF-CTERM protein
MSARPPRCGVGAVVVVLLAATVGPWVGVGAATASAASASFAENVVYEQRGDVANITVTTSQASTVNLGSPEQGFWLQVRVGSGTTKLRLDTHKAGEWNRYRLSEMVWATRGSISKRTLRTPTIEAPLDVARYQLNVTVNGREQALSALVVEERATNDVTARIAPGKTDVSELNSAADLRGASVAPWNGSVAREDWLFLHVDVSGVRGALSKARLDGDGGIMRVDFEQTNPPMNGRANEFTGASVADIVVPGDSEGFYLIVDTGANGIEAGDRYEVRFTIPEGSELADSKETVSTNVRIAERRVNIEQRPRGETLVVENRTTLRGSTTLTPGSIINISARSADVPPFHRPRTVTVSSERTFEVTYDFSDLDPGREFEVRLADQQRTIPAQVEPRPPATTQPPETTRPPETNETTATEPGGDSDGRTTAPTETTENATTTAEGLTQVGMEDTREPLTQQASKNESGVEGGDGSGGPVPGFGPIASVVALAAGALLAARRR